MRPPSLTRLTSAADNCYVTLEINPFSPEAMADPYPGYARLRDEAPLFRHELFGVWIVSRYEDVVAIARDYATFSNAAGFTTPPDVHMDPRLQTPSLLRTDPPDHSRLRALVARAFTPRMVAELDQLEAQSQDTERSARRLAKNIIIRSS